MNLKDWELIGPGIYKRSDELIRTEKIDLVPDLSDLDEDYKQIMIEMGN